MKSSGIITVSQLNFYVKSLLDGDAVLSGVFLSGEISNLTDHYRSGHIYLSLKDEKSVIKCVMFAGNAARLKFALQNGMKVIAYGKVSLYEAAGQYQFYIEQIQPDGVGALTIAYEQLKEKLEREGLFDKKRKKQLPQIPRKIGVITSPTGAARRDIENVLKRRFPLAEVILCPAAVQGECAVPQLINALEYLDKNNLADVIILGRGGGSIEDLWAFNDEKLARTVASCKIPVISAVGHETDFTICDFVSDMRAPTPSAAAEIAAPDINEMQERINNIIYTLKFLINKKIESEKIKIDILHKNKVFSSPFEIIENHAMRLDSLTAELKNSYEGMLNKRRQRLENVTGRLNALSPLQILSRGYGIPVKNGKTVKSAKDIKSGDAIELILSEGKALCTVNEIKE